MSQPNSTWFHLGKEARANDKPCQCPPDGRMSKGSRQEWYDGWNYQDALMSGPASQEAYDNTANFLKGLKAELQASNHDS